MWIILLLLMTGIAQADVYVITAPDKSVRSISEQDDAVVPEGYKKDILKNKKISDLNVTMGEEQVYDFGGGRFTPNSQKIKDRNKQETDRILKEQKNKTDRQSAIDKLKALGLTDSELNALLGR